MRARSFFFVCLGLLCIVAAYHLGARNAGAQAGEPVVGGIYLPNSVFSAVVGRTLYVKDLRVVAGIPGTSPVVACSSDLVTGEVMLENGDCYRQDGAGPWNYAGNVFGGATATQGATWGQLKAKYATPAPGAARVTR
jgi:hypothetical protein